MTASDLHRELDVAVNLAHQASQAIMGYYPCDLVVNRKRGNEPVTKADRVADRLIIDGLIAAFPGDGLLTEESDDDLSRLDKERVWIVDPLDGTTEFISGTGEFSVHIALAHLGQPVLGVVLEPAKERLFYAVRGEGAYQVELGQRMRLHVSTVTDPAEMCMIASRSHYSPLVDAARQALRIKTVKRAGSVGLKVSQVVRGECDVYLATTVSKEWDFCAPHALLLEAGGVLTDLWGQPLTYNKADVRTHTGLLASNGLAHEQIVATLAPLRCQT